MPTIKTLAVNLGKGGSPTPDKKCGGMWGCSGGGGVFLWSTGKNFYIQGMSGEKLIQGSHFSTSILPDFSRTMISEDFPSLLDKAFWRKLRSSS